MKTHTLETAREGTPAKHIHKHREIHSNKYSYVEHKKEFK